MAQLKPSEFSGSTQRNTIAPPITPAGTKGHEPDNGELLKLRYLTGQIEDSTADPVDGVFEGLLPLTEAEEARPTPRKWADS